MKRTARSSPRPDRQEVPRRDNKRAQLLGPRRQELHPLEVGRKISKAIIYRADDDPGEDPPHPGLRRRLAHDDLDHQLQGHTLVSASYRQ